MLATGDCTCTRRLRRRSVPGGDPAGRDRPHRREPGGDALAGLRAAGARAPGDRAGRVVLYVDHGDVLTSAGAASGTRGQNLAHAGGPPRSSSRCRPPFLPDPDLHTRDRGPGRRLLGRAPGQDLRHRSPVGLLRRPGTSEQEIGLIDLTAATRGSSAPCSYQPSPLCAPPPSPGAYYQRKRNQGKPPWARPSSPWPTAASRPCTPRSATTPSTTHSHRLSYPQPLDTPHRGTPGSLEDRGKTSCPQQLAQPRTTNKATGAWSEADGGAGGTEGVDLPPDGVPRVPPCPIACQGAIPYHADKHPRLRMDLAECREPSPMTDRHHWSRTAG